MMLLSLKIILLCVYTCAYDAYFVNDVSAVKESQSVTTEIYVMNPIDSEGDVTACYPTTNNLCNLRSAWSACQAVLSDQCLIVLPEERDIFMDISAYGYLSLQSENSIMINGRNSTITPMNGSASELFFYERNNTESTTGNVSSLFLINMTIANFGTDNSQQLPQGDGAIISSYGNIFMYLIDITFYNITSNSGSVLFMSDNNKGSLSIEKCFFVKCKAANKGGVRISLSCKILTLTQLFFYFFPTLSIKTHIMMTLMAI